MLSPGTARERKHKHLMYTWRRPGGVKEVKEELHRLELQKPGRNAANYWNGPTHELWPGTHVMWSYESIELVRMARSHRACFLHSERGEIDAPRLLYSCVPSQRRLPFACVRACAELTTCHFCCCCHKHNPTRHDARTFAHARS